MYVLVGIQMQPKDHGTSAAQRASSRNRAEFDSKLDAASKCDADDVALGIRLYNVMLPTKFSMGHCSSTRSMVYVKDPPHI